MVLQGRTITTSFRFGEEKLFPNFTEGQVGTYLGWYFGSLSEDRLR